MKKLIILCGASGTGKTTIQNYLLKQYGIPRVLTHTTRAKRKGEKDGVDYYFETPVSFAPKHYFESVTYDGKASTALRAKGLNGLGRKIQPSA